MGSHTHYYDDVTQVRIYYRKLSQTEYSCLSAQTLTCLDDIDTSLNLEVASC